MGRASSPFVPAPRGRLAGIVVASLAAAVSSCCTVIAAALLLGGCAAPTGMGQPGPAPPAGPATASAAPTVAPDPAHERPPIARDGWPRAPSDLSRAVGVYWPVDDDPEVQRDGAVVISLDEAGRAWLFARVERDWTGFVVAVSGGPTGFRIEAADGVELPAALRGVRFRVQDERLAEDRGDSPPTWRTRDRARELALLAPGTTLEALAPSTGALVAHGPLLVGHRMGRGADECWIGLALPYPPAAPNRQRDAPGRLVGAWIGDSVRSVPGAPCGLAAHASARPIEVEGAIADLVLLADASGPLALVAVGYMAALPFVPKARVGDPAVARAMAEGLRAAE